MSDCLITPTQAIDFANRDISRLVGNITLLLMRRAPYADILDGGVFESAVSDEQRNIVMERPVLNQSLVLPTFFNDTDTCADLGQTVETGSTEYTTKLGTIRGRGPKVCVKQMRSAFQASYSATQDAIQKQLLYFMNVDVRSQLLLRSGVKIKLNTTYTFPQMLSGDVQAIDVSFNDDNPPDTPLTFAFLKYLETYCHESFLSEPFESEAGTIAKFIGGADIIDNLRAELNVRYDMRALTTGKYELGESTLTGYTWMGPYQGIALGIDQQPLRFDGFEELNGQLVPQFIEPEIAVQVSKGIGARANPDYLEAQYEIGFLIFSNSFRRLVPEMYTGAGEFRFPPQFSQGELEFAVIRDNDCNTFGDFGYHIFQITRAYRPERPHAVVPVAFKRCVPDFGFSTCVGYPGGITSTGGVGSLTI
jgi:hypothetical protein